MCVVSNPKLNRVACALTALALALPASYAAAQTGPGASAPAPSPSGPRAPLGAAVREVGGSTFVSFAEHQRFRPAGGSPVERAEAVLGRVLGDLGRLDHVGRLVPRRVLEAHGYTVVRFERHALGDLLVPGASAIVRFDAADRVELVLLDLGSPAAHDPGGAIVPAPDAGAIRASGFEGAEILERRLVAFDDGATLRRAWSIEVQRAAHERVRVWLDAADGSLLLVEPRIRHGRGRVWEPNPVVAEDMPSDVELPNLTSSRFLTGRYVRARSCRPTGVSECLPEQRAVADEEGDFLYDPDDPAFDDEFSEVNVYFHTDRVAEYFRSAHGLEWTCCEESSIIDVVANYVEIPGVAFENAFYSPSLCSRSQCALMAFGQGQMRDFGYDGDVVYHEYGHGIVDVTAELAPFDVDARLGVGYEPGALNEGIADYFSSTITGDPRLADYLAGGTLGGESSLRELDNDLRCPDDLFGQVHADGRIWGATLWEIREAIGIEKADALAFAWLTTSPSTATLGEAGELLLETAESLEVLEAADVETVRGIVEGRGLPGCERVVPMESGRTYQGYSGQDVITGNLGGGVVPLHYAIDIPADATRLTLNLQKRTFAGTYDLYVRDGERVRYVGARMPPLVADASFTGVGEVELTETSEHALPRCQTLYMAIVATDLTTSGQSLYELTADLETSGDADAECPELPMDAGVEADAGVGADDAGATGDDAGPAEMPMDGGDDGCGCAAPGVGGALPPVPLVLGGLMLWAWRRRS
ncbi:MAG: hypothetical protein CMN31_12365 [Sandaracinus sp.]|nr:hypothetical protein [Sandaracinus sp.]